MRPLSQASPRNVLIGTFALFLGPFLMVELFPEQLDTVIDIGTYVAFHNTAEFFSIMVSLSVFSVGWYTYEQSKDRHALFLGIAFLAVGLIDFMHTMSNRAMPDFITPNSTNKSTQFWIAARLFGAAALLISSYVHPDSRSRWLSKITLMTSALVVTGLLFTAITFFPSYLPATAVQGTGLTPFKRYAEFFIIFLLVLSAIAYWMRMIKTGNSFLIYYLAAFIICIFSEALFASYTTGFDTYNVLGHIYKVAAFYMIYKGVFIASVQDPYVKLAEAGARIRRFNTELEQRVSERTSQLEAANKELEAFSYSVSHDLRAPLRHIAGFSEVLGRRLEGRVDEKSYHYISSISGSAKKMGVLINDLLAFSRVGRAEMSMGNIVFKELCKDVICGLEAEAQGRDIEWTMGELPDVYGERALLEIVLVNLVSNALKFTQGRSRTEIEINCREDAGEYVFFVKDNGVGFDMKYANKLFGVFQRLHSQDQFEGTGIGLANVQRVISRHGGRVWAEGAVDQGATFYFTLPKAKAV